MERLFEAAITDVDYESGTFDLDTHIFYTEEECKAQLRTKYLEWLHKLENENITSELEPTWWVIDIMEEDQAVRKIFAEIKYHYMEER